MSLLHRQPFKALYILAELTNIVLLHVPFWIIASIPKSSRPRPSWSITRSVLVYGLRRYFILNSKVGGILKSPNYLALQGGKEVYGIWVSPAPDLLQGRIREQCEKAGSESIRLPGYWYTRKGETFDRKYKPSGADKVLYTLHGGGFVAFSAHPSDPLAPIAHGIIKESKSLNRVFCVEYRLSKWDLKNHTTHPFPTALVDAITGYNYLVNELGYAPQNIIVEGDSAGANLALALTRYLLENSLPNLSPPGGLILVCPWSDLSLSHVKAGSSALPARNADVLTPTEYGPGTSYYSVRSYVGPDNLSATQTDPYISPASLDIPKPSFKNFPRTLMIAGDGELQLDMMRTLRDRMAEDIGDLLDYYEVPDAVHDFLCLEWFEPERTTTLQKIAEWVGP
ncbi:alpha/beta-hydrolase [Gymnopilus junonius]|uniref:Alpha/beta-hydrolase n=1 Tax=Gymnopilus junonius TaxID=109634 RepID=A0A9P5TPM6_GYMJU|nr:alpha/beta-hydrolase [Gymnopilus junonius]